MAAEEKKQNQKPKNKDNSHRKSTEEILRSHLNPTTGLDETPTRKSVNSLKASENVYSSVNISQKVNVIGTGSLNSSQGEINRGPRKAGSMQIALK